MYKITLKINDESIDERFKTYLKKNALKYVPFHVIQSLMFSVMNFIAFGFGFRFMSAVFYFICSVIGFIITRRHLWTVPYFTIFLTEFPIIYSIIVAFYIEEDKLYSETELGIGIEDDIKVVWVSGLIVYHTVIF